jgi:hypothetical protein
VKALLGGSPAVILWCGALPVSSGRDHKDVGGDLGLEGDVGSAGLDDEGGQALM